MKRMIPLLLFICLFLSYCNISAELGEHEGMFAVGITSVPEDYECNHSLRYDNPENYSELYPRDEYHYVQCIRSLQFGVCTLTGEFEPHTRVFYIAQSGTILMYNGRYYHAVMYSCSVCGSYNAGTGYILCKENLHTCEGDCGAIEEMQKGEIK